MRDARAGLRLVLLGAALLLLACAGERVPPHRGIDLLWGDYVEMPEARALAVAGDPNHLWVGAAAGGAASQSDAEREALERCQRRRVARRMQAPCLLYASGDEIVWKQR